MTPSPRFVQIEPVGQCNLRCRMCPILYRKDGPPHGPLAFLDFEAFTRLLDELPALEELHLQGLGEPMMHPRFFEMIRYAADRGIRVTTNSNLTLLNARRAKLCVDSGLSVLHVSIDGATRETYEHIRTGARWDLLQENLHNLLDALEASAGRLPRLHMVAVVMKRNLVELPDLVRFAHHWTFKEMFVQHLCHDFGESTLPPTYQPMHGFVQSQSLLDEQPDRVATWFERARFVASQLDIPLRLPSIRLQEHAEGTPGRHRCDWPWRAAYISYHGDAMPCCMVATPDRMQFGDVFAGGFHNVWNSEAYEQFRARLDSDDPPEICRSCSVYRGTF